MFPGRDFFDPSLVSISALGLIVSILSIFAIPRPHVVRTFALHNGRLLGVIVGLSAIVGYAATGNLARTLAAALVVTTLCIVIRQTLPRLSALGVARTALTPASLICISPWGYLMLREQGFPAWALAAFALGAAIGLGLFAFRFAARLVDEAVFTHAHWRRPTHAPPERLGGRPPKVSIHVPCYAEPPEVVIQTLQRLAELRYPNFEVIVCDNNTPDETLWRPVQRYCAMLNARMGERFRFFHVSPLEGAKAGALNWSLERTAEDAELVAVVDADYLAEPDFLSRLTQFFADPNVGFVQTPHDYRRDGSAYQAMCYWEYMPPNKVELASVNEYDCAYTIGTMCILRKDAIRAAGGWAEWCLTEDSEISIRIRALGYQGVYVNETFGRGLIPETFEDYKKQRFRWTAGPVQQLLAHWRLFLPVALGGSRAMHGWVKLMEAHRSLAPVLATLGVIYGLVTSGVLFGLTVAGLLPQIEFPAVFWVAGAMSAIAGSARLWHRYRLTGCTSLQSMAGAEIARLSLGLVKAVAALAPFTGLPLRWRRTPKFAADSALVRGLWDTAPETGAAATFLLTLSLAVHHASDLGSHVAAVLIVSCITGAIAFATAPAMAVLSELRLRARQAGAIGQVEEIVEPALPRAA
jgi:hypothetical protein